MVEEVRMFPRWFYKQGEEPRLCASEEEATALGAGWSDEIPAAMTAGREMPHGVQESPPSLPPSPPPSPPDEEDDVEPEGSTTPRRRR